QVKNVLEGLATIGYKELKKSGVFLLPGFAKFVVIKKPATKASQGTNPFTKEPMTFKAKPARKIVRARPVKAAKDALDPRVRRSKVGCAFRSRRSPASAALRPLLPHERTSGVGLGMSQKGHERPSVRREPSASGELRRWHKHG